jgi:hypothetical protein
VSARFPTQEGGNNFFGADGASPAQDRGGPWRGLLIPRTGLFRGCEGRWGNAGTPSVFQTGPRLFGLTSADANFGRTRSSRLARRLLYMRGHAGFLL